jgi:putative peptide maturation dehydrogenase
MRVRRRRICFIQIADELVPDLGELFSGELKFTHETSAHLLCPVSGERLRVQGDELGWLSNLSSNEWTEASRLLEDGRIDAATLDDLIRRRIVISDIEGDRASQAILEAENRFESIGWYELTAMYHAMTRWTGVADESIDMEHTPEAHRGRLEKVMDRHGPPPTHFPRRADALATHALQRPDFDSPLARILKARRTTRVFDTARTLPQEELAYLLYGCFGAQGTRELAPGATAVKRTSASGGGLTPIDPYPFIMRVEGLASGIYHYDMSRHALELLKPVPEQELRDLLMDMTAGQDYFARAQAAVIHVARFDRHHWKYRGHKKAYKALLMDSAHLSQTFYLLATERSLGAFYTAAINDQDLGTYLGLDPLEAAPVGVSGLGIVGDETNIALHFNPEPYDPSPDSP